jgi:RNA polymerase sigma factor (sigma-70 family)
MDVIPLRPGHDIAFALETKTGYARKTGNLKTYPPKLPFKPVNADRIPVYYLKGACPSVGRTVGGRVPVISLKGQEVPVIAQQATSAQRPSNLRPANVVAPEQGCSSVLPVDDLEQGQVYAKQYARHFCRHNPTIDFAEVESLAILGALEAWRSYSKDHGGAWRTYLSQMVKWSISNGLRPKNQRSYRKHVEACGIALSIEQMGTTSQPRYAGSDNPSRPVGSDCIPDPRIRFEIQFEYRELLNALPEMERWVLVQRYYESLTFEEIVGLLGGADGGWSRAKVWRIHQQAIKRLRIMVEA